MKPLFGICGYPKNFLNSSLGQNRENIFSWLSTLNLDVLELDWTYGINMNDTRIKRYIKLAKINNILIIIHAPKEIDFLTDNEKIYEKSINDLKRSITLAKKLEVNKIVLRLGNKSINNQHIYEKLSNIFNKEPDITFYIEPNPRLNYFGSVDDIMKINSLTNNVTVAFNLANIHIREGLSLTNELKIISLLKKYQKQYPHIYEDAYFKIYPIAYSLNKEPIAKQFGDIKMGQLSFFDINRDYYPKATDYVRAILKLKINPIIVSNTFESEEIGAMILRDKHYLEQMKDSF